MILFHQRDKKKGNALSKSNIKDLIKLSSPETVLTEDKRSRLLAKIESACQFEKKHFDNKCLSLIHVFINYCQLLPETANSHYSQPGGFIDYALNRTEAALSLFKGYLVLDHTGQLSEEQKLWQYALFSAAFLQGIGKCYIDLTVKLLNKTGTFLRIWNPIIENIASQDTAYYSYTFNKPTLDDEFRHRLNSLIARFLMPKEGLKWIASNTSVLETWLALLNEDLYKAGTLGIILDRAKALALQQHFNQFHPERPIEPSTNYDKAHPFATNIPTESTIDKELQVGLEFIRWLTEALRSGTLIIDKLPILLVPGGLLLNTEIFKQFIKDNPHYKAWPAVQNGFLALGIHRLGAGGQLVSRYEHAGSHHVQEGIFVSQFGLALPDEVLVHNHQSGKTNWVSAIELTNRIGNSQGLTELTPNGKWEATKAQSSQMEFNPRG